MKQIAVLPHTAGRPGCRDKREKNRARNESRTLRRFASHRRSGMANGCDIGAVCFSVDALEYGRARNQHVRSRGDCQRRRRFIDSSIHFQFAFWFNLISPSLSSSGIIRPSLTFLRSPRHTPRCS